MKQTTTSIIQLIDNGKAIYTIEIENIEAYYFVHDNNGLNSLSITPSYINMRDLGLLITHEYDSYVLMARKAIEIDNETTYYSIPPIAYRYIKLVDDNGKVNITFSKKIKEYNGEEDESNDNKQ